RLLAHAAQHAMSGGLQFGDRVADRLRRFDVELDPGLGRRDLLWPAIGAEARLGSLAKRPHAESLHPVQVVVGPIIRRGLRELDAQPRAPERAAGVDVPDDGSEAGYEAHLHRS